MLTLRTGLSIIVAAASLARCGMCEPDRGPGGAPSASAAPSVSLAEAATTASSHVVRPLPGPRPACKVIALDGDVHLESEPDAGKTPLLLRGLVPADGFLDLTTGARFVAKDPRTARETTFRGPGRVKSCVAYGEESWVVSGGFDSSVGAGESPGAEEWVVTPLGVIRYGAAKLTVDVRAHGDKSEVKVAVGSGGAFVWTTDDAKVAVAGGGARSKADDGWIRADTGVTTVKSSGAGDTSLDGAKDAVAQCVSLGKDAHDLSAIVLAGGADAGTVTTQVITRRLARAACAVGGLRVSAQPPSEALGPLIVSLATGNTGWNTLPSPPP